MTPSKPPFAKAIVLAAILLTSLPAILPAQTTPMAAAEARRRAEELLKQMTIEEKVGQMNQSSGVVMPLLATEKPDNLIVQGKVGSILWLIDVKEINRLQHLAVENPVSTSPSSSPLMLSTAIAPSSPSRSPWLHPGIREWKRPHSGSPARTRALPASGGPSPPWSTSPATPVGAASLKVPAKIPISAPPWPARRSSDFRASRWPGQRHRVRQALRRIWRSRRWPRL